MPDVDIGSLTLQISANAKSASTTINNLTKSLGGLKETVNGMSGLSDVAAQLRFLGQGMQSLSGSSNAFKEFKSVSSAIKSAIKSLQELDNIDLDHATEQISQLTSTLGMLSEVNKAQGFTSTVNALKKLPDVAKDLNNMDIYEFAANIIEISGALEPLASQMDRISSGFAQLPQRLNRLTTASNNAAAGVGRFGTMMSRVFSLVMLRRVANVLGGLIKKSTEYVEDLNLFTVAMGQYATEAQRYAETVSEVMGIDVAQWLRAQGVFQTLATGFGVSADRAAIMSKNLTQLAYDLSSFYNLDIDKAMQKLESGFAGEIEPVRRLGYDLSKTTLQATAADLGITKLFADMTQAEKSQLRYYALMTQVTQVQGDMARTLTAPANQLRILTAQLEMAKRALGNIFIPALNAVLPYLIAFAKFVRYVADEIARFFGYTLPEIDYSDISVGIGDVEDSVEDLSGSLGHASSRAKELKGLLASFDQLNIIQSETGGGNYGGSGGVGGLSSSGWNDFELPQYDFLKNVLASKADAIFEKMKKTLDKMRPILRFLVDNFGSLKQIAIGIGAILAGWKIAKGIENIIGNWATIKRGLGITAMIGGFGLEFISAKNIGAGKATIWDYIKTALGAALGIAGSLIVFGTGPAGWIIGIGAALTVLIAGITIGGTEALRQQIEAAFFNGVGRPIQEVADEYNSHMNGIVLSVQPILDIAESIGTVDSEIQTAQQNIDSLFRSLEEGKEVTDTDVEQIILAFSNLYDGLSEKLNLCAELVRTTITSAFYDAAEAAGVAVPQMLGQLALLSGEMSGRMAENRAETEALLNSMRGMVVGSEEFNVAAERLGSLTRESYLLAGSMDPAIGAWERLKESIQNGVDFQSVDEATAAIQAMVQGTKDASEAYKLVYEENDNIFRSWLTWAKESAPEWVPVIENMMLTNKRVYEANITELENEFMGMANVVQDSLGEHLLDVIRSVDSNNMGDYMDIANQTARSFIDPIANELRSGFEELGIDGNVWGSDVVTQIINGMEHELTDDQGRILLYDIDRLNDSMGTHFAYGAQTALEYFKRSLNDKKPGVIQAVTDAGSEMGTGFANGISTGIAAGTSAIGRRLERWWGNMRPVSGDASNPFTWGTLHVEPYASGGFPRAGALFLAGEGGGAELVGSMGNQTAVANRDQIVAGIAYGVSQANAEEARLLREILGYVRKVAQNGGNVVFSPSPEAGRAISYAMDMYATQRGY